MFEIMSSTEAGLENNMYMLVMMPSKWNVHAGWQSSEVNLAGYKQGLITTNVFFCTDAYIYTKTKPKKLHAALLN